ncbi:MAG TPA: hypothetical protein VFF61_09555, partial [Microvirga sp.]|nr:hypothetical protein [Microvirga sp.]
KKNTKQTAKKPDVTPVIEEDKAKSKSRVSVTVKPVTGQDKKPAAKKDQKADAASKPKSAAN